MTTTTGTAHLYRRVSTVRQEGSGLGLDAQLHALELEAQRRGWETVEDHVETASGGAAVSDRPVLAAVLDRLDREGGLLVVARLDRLSRSVVHAAGILDRARRGGWAVVALDVGIDTTTPAGMLMSNVLASTAQYERDLIRERITDALAARKRAGARLGEPVRLPQETRDRIARERAQGLSLRRIAQGLTQDNIPTARGGTWHASTVRHVLQSLELDAAAERARAERADLAGIDVEELAELPQEPVDA